VSETQQLPRTLLGAIRYFKDADVATEFVAQLRWPDGPVCPTCGGQEYSYLTTRRLWKCKACKRQYSVKVGTIFEDSAIPLDKWLASIWLIANSKNGVSSYELGRAVGLTQKSAWFVLHRIRLAMQTGSFDRFDGEVEVDETFIGGKARNMHAWDRKRRVKGKGGMGSGKAPVVGAIQRGKDGRPSQVQAFATPNTQQDTLHRIVYGTTEPGSKLYTDAAAGYSGLREDYSHETVDHAEEYVRGNVHTNSIENFWSLLKRGLHGTYVSVEPYHLFRYLDERMFAFNERDLTDLGRFTRVLAGVSGRRLTYAQLTGKA
jgi:transposase-like protein